VVVNVLSHLIFAIIHTVSKKRIEFKSIFKEEILE